MFILKKNLIKIFKVLDFRSKKIENAIFLLYKKFSNFI